ncbi:MAG: hypothetical protein AAGF98_14395 [Cyanobacteria bacterium P01_H01_bin.153]
MASVLRSLDTIAPLLADDGPPSSGTSRYEVFDRATQHLHAFATTEEMPHWLNTQPDWHEP